MRDVLAIINADGATLPWSVCDEPANDLWYQGRTIHGHGKRVADVAGHMMPEVAAAVARLIAAAPELLFALRQLHDDVDEYQHINHLGGHDNHVLRVARAAIEKATGVPHPDVREKLQK